MKMRLNRRMRLIGAGSTAAVVMLAMIPVVMTSYAGASSRAHVATGTLTIGVGAAPQSLDPSADDNGDGLFTAELLYEPLVNETDQGKFIPGLASSWHY